MAAPDVALLEATIKELKAELSRARVQAEVFRALYERQATEIDELLVPQLGGHARALQRSHLRVVADGEVAAAGSD